MLKKIIMLYILDQYNVMCQLYLNETGKNSEKEFLVE